MPTPNPAIEMPPPISRRRGNEVARLNGGIVEPLSPTPTCPKNLIVAWGCAHSEALRDNFLCLDPALTADC
jgi:hypothetical protein